MPTGSLVVLFRRKLKDRKESRYSFILLNVEFCNWPTVSLEKSLLAEGRYMTDSVIQSLEMWPALQQRQI